MNLLNPTKKYIQKNNKNFSNILRKYISTSPQSLKHIIQVRFAVEKELLKKSHKILEST